MAVTLVSLLRVSEILLSLLFVSLLDVLLCEKKVFNLCFKFFVVIFIVFPSSVFSAEPVTVHLAIDAEH